MKASVKKSFICFCLPFLDGASSVNNQTALGHSLNNYITCNRWLLYVWIQAPKSAQTSVLPVKNLGRGRSKSSWNKFINKVYKWNILSQTKKSNCTASILSIKHSRVGLLCSRIGHASCLYFILSYSYLTNLSIINMEIKNTEKLISM